MRRPLVKIFVLATIGAAALALGVSSPALASTPCWRALINDWYDGRIDQTYPIACYTDAIQHLPQDVDTYSSAKEDIQRAMLAQIRSGRGEQPSWIPGSGDDGTKGGSGGSKGIITRAIEWLGPSNASAVPLPLLILAGVAFLLLAAAGGSFVSRRIQERRLPPQP